MRQQQRDQEAHLDPSLPKYVILDERELAENRDLVKTVGTNFFSKASVGNVFFSCQIV